MNTDTQEAIDCLFEIVKLMQNSYDIGLLTQDNIITILCQKFPLWVNDDGTNELVEAMLAKMTF